MNKMRLILAEDEVELSNALVAILKHNTYDVQAVYDVQSTLEQMIILQIH